MKFRVSQYTPYLLISLAITMIILLFIAAVIGISCMWIVICYFCYLFANLIITLGLPVMLGYLLEAVLPKNMVLVITGLLILFTTQIVWRLCSDKIFNKLIEWDIPPRPSVLLLLFPVLFVLLPADVAVPWQFPCF